MLSEGRSGRREQRHGEDRDRQEAGATHGPRP
jgi:hypothetical protein